jgi:hypothetical protein
MTRKKEQKESDLLNTQRFTGQQKARHLA